MPLSMMWLKCQCLSTSLLQDYMQIHKSFVSVVKLGSWAGNLMLKHKHPEFQSDVYTMLETVGAQLEIGNIVNFMS